MHFKNPVTLATEISKNKCSRHGENIKGLDCNITQKNDITTAIGTYSGFQSICTMLASSLSGLVWFKFAAGATFMVTAIATSLVIAYFIVAIKTTKKYNKYIRIFF